MSNSDEKRLTIDPEVYPLEAVQAAAYVLTDRAFVRIDQAESGGTLVALKSRDGAADAAVLEGDFYNELLHQSLRLRVSKANQSIREYIVTKALVSAQMPGLPPALEAPCAQCAAPSAAPPAAPPVDPELEKEIEKLLVEIDQSETPGGDPLGVAVPWEEKFGEKKKDRVAPARRRRRAADPA